jgi:hypothetical protein
MPPALDTAAATSRQWVKAKMGNSMPSFWRISVFMARLLIGCVRGDGVG